MHDERASRRTPGPSAVVKSHVSARASCGLFGAVVCTVLSETSRQLHKRVDNSHARSDRARGGASGGCERTTLKTAVSHRLRGAPARQRHCTNARCCEALQVSQTPHISHVQSAIHDPCAPVLNTSMSRNVSRPWPFRGVFCPTPQHQPCYGVVIALVVLLAMMPSFSCAAVARGYPYVSIITAALPHFFEK